MHPVEHLFVSESAAISLLDRCRLPCPCQRPSPLRVLRLLAVLLLHTSPAVLHGTPHALFVRQGESSLVGAGWLLVLRALAAAHSRLKGMFYASGRL